MLPRSGPGASPNRTGSRSRTRSRPRTNSFFDRRPSTWGVRAEDASLNGPNVRVARRRLVSVFLKDAIALDVQITSFDVSARTMRVCVTTAKVAYILNLENTSLLFKLGRSSGSVHRETIRCCQFSQDGWYLGTAGEDKRVVIWNLKTQKADTVLEGHKGVVYQLKFSYDNEKLLSCSDDGRVLVWDWKLGTIVGSFMRHESAVRCFAFSMDNPNRIVCGRNDGVVTSWDTVWMSVVDDISPDIEWLERQDEASLGGWADPTKHHTGSVVCLGISPNNRFLATGSMDNTCKLWDVTSYMKDFNAVQKDMEDAMRFCESLDMPIDIREERFDAQIELKDYTGLKIGDVPIPVGYHADLWHTFRHEGPVLCVCFTLESDIVVTGSLDASCRLWSVRTGDLLFQVNTPAAVTELYLAPGNRLFCACQKRLLHFMIHCTTKEEDLPLYWQQSHIDEGIEKLMEEDVEYYGTDMGGRLGLDPGAAKTGKEKEMEAAAGGNVEDQDPATLGNKKHTINEIRNYISHGLLQPSFLVTLLDQFPEVDANQLFQNIQKFRLPARHILRLIVNNNFHPRDILLALSTKKNPHIIYGLVESGASITQYMVQQGYRPADMYSDANAIYLSANDLKPAGKLPYVETDAKRQARRQQFVTGQGGWDDVYDEDDDDDDDGMFDESAMLSDYIRNGAPKGTILHFIPSVQLKLLRDFQARRDLKPIFLRNFVNDSNLVTHYPNFDLEGDVSLDSKPNIQSHSVSNPGVRFNEKTFEKIMVKGKRSDRQPPSKLDFRPAPHAGRPLDQPLPLALKGSLASSMTLFKPDRYMNVKALDVREGRGPKAKRGSVVAQPIVIRQQPGTADMKFQLIVGKTFSVDEKRMDGPQQ
ncbi:WD40-repeat-containing domain protein [Cladochytrium replicatum]|nr:WD40-repeat-containing domain protein [Cladochytrium replicatum]